MLRILKLHIFGLVAITGLVGLGYYRQSCKPQARILQTVYGPISVHEPVLLELLDSPAVQRLKKIHQYGPVYQVGNANFYSRYQHSIGVFALLRKQNCSLKEQIAGLLHDASHTVFSHVGDHFQDHHSSGRPVKTYTEKKDSYQDEIHMWALKHYKIDKLLAKYNLTISDIMHKNNGFVCLDCDLPDMCADRIEYNLQGGLIRGLITQDELESIYADLNYSDGTWYFTRPELAKKFANLSLVMTETLWGDPKGLYLYRLVAQMMKYAVDKKMLTVKDVHFSNDEYVWDLLTGSDDVYLQAKTKEVYNHDKLFQLANKTDYDLFLKSKHRGIDPLVKMKNKMIHLSKIDHEFKREYHRIKKVKEDGYHLKLSHVEAMPEHMLGTNVETRFIDNSHAIA